MMEPHPTVHCARCRATIRLAPIGVPPRGIGDSDASNILARCPRCREWTWTVMQTQSA